MSDYAIFFDYDNKTYRLPVNPEQIETTTAQAISKYEVLKLGQIAIPTHMELREYSFECELPKNPLHYIETPNEFKEPSFYLNLFRKWRTELKPIRFIASNNAKDEINILVLFEDMTVVEKAGEEGDKLISLKLLECPRFGKKSEVVVKVVADKKVAVIEPKKEVVAVSPKSSGSHVVQKGDTLWGIAKKYYGNGAEYTKIFNANKDKIKNPNLIYPATKLVIP